MSMELIAIISVGVTLAGLILNSQRNLRADMQAQRDETGSEFKTVRADMQAQLVETKTEFKAQREETKTEFKAQREAIISLLERMAPPGRIAREPAPAVVSRGPARSDHGPSRG